ncbi:MAG: protein-L-isoaspartate(D-aspartate) O-methyltransferase [Parcubacteria group bacterium]|nr:protein-L-isoaspartate(D-aspartate) O-methyltransferase [Parcubacteria group bacterium]
MLLVTKLVNSGYLKTSEIISAFRKIKRQDFIRPAEAGRAEINAPLNIGYGQTISQPATVAFMLEKLQPEPGEKILDVGAGSGWTAALLAEAVGDRGRVYGLERIKELRDFAAANVNKYGFIKKGIVQIICTDGYKGLPELAPFDKILVSAAAEEIPDELLKQLKIGGRLVLPLGKKSQAQSIIVIEKFAEGEFKIKEYPGFIFVPLVKDN